MEPPRDTHGDGRQRGVGAVLLAAGALGMVAIVAQLALLRELLAAFSGNELVFGIGLAGWLVLTGLGALLGRAGKRLARPRCWIAGGLMLASVLPLAQIAAVRLLRDVVFVRGAAVGVEETLGATLVVLAPFCLVSGALLTLASGVAGSGVDGAARAGGIGRVYTADTLGSIAGGVLFAWVLVPWLDHMGLVGLPAVAGLIMAAVLAARERARWLAAGGVAVAVACAAVFIWVDLDALTTARQHEGRTVVFRGNSPYGRLVVTEESGELTFFENGRPVLASHDVLHAEEAAHYALCQRPDAPRVLLIGGAVSGVAREVLRHRDTEVVAVEIDPLFIEAGRRLLPENMANPRLRIVRDDGRRFVQTTDERFDVVIVDVPDPSTVQWNRFHTAEFFAEVRRVLAPDGVLAFGVARYENFIGRELAQVLATVHATVRPAFANVRMLPGGRVFFIASDGPVTLDIARVLQARGIGTQWLTRSRMDATLAEDRLADLERAVAVRAEVNRDFAPALLWHHMRHWVSQFEFRWRLLTVVACVCFAVYVIAVGPVPRVVLATGFAASAVELALMVGFQALYGSLYREVAVIVSVFMAGLAAGAWVAGRRTDLVRAQPVLAVCGAAGGVALFALAIGVALPELRALGIATGMPWAGRAVIWLATFGLALLVGGQFAVAGASETMTRGALAGAGRLYAADLVGAAAGAFVVSAVALPLLGATIVCAASAALILVATAVAWWRRNLA